MELPTQKCSNSSNPKDKTLKMQEEEEDNQVNHAEIVTQDNFSHELVMGTWYGCITKSQDTNAIPICTLAL